MALLLIVWLSRLGLPHSRDAFRLLPVGLVGFGLSLGAQFVGTDLSNAVNGALVPSASPAFILIFAALILHEPMTLPRIGAVLLATDGILVILNPLTADFTSAAFAGMALRIAALTW